MIDFRWVPHLRRRKFVFEWWLSDYSTSKTLKNLFKSFFKQRIYRIHFWEIEFILANPHIGRFKQFIGWVVGRCLCNHLEADQAMKLALIVNVKSPRRTGMKFVRGKGFVFSVLH